MKSLTWIAGVAVALALLGCGGADPDVASAAVDPQVQVQVTPVPAGLKISAVLPGLNVTAAVVKDSTQYSFSARLTQGPQAGQELSGLLVLQGDGNGASTQMDGAIMGTARLSATPAQRDQFDTTTQSLRASLRSDIETAAARLRDALQSSTGATALTPAQSQALQQFKQSFADLNNQYRNAVSALSAQLQTAAAPTEATVPDLLVSGSIDGQGQAALGVALVVVLADQSVLQATATSAADGTLTGQLASADGTLLGTWTATPQAMPAAAPVGNVIAGKQKYTNLCANCHTDNVRSNVFNVAAANSVARLDAAVAGIGSMTFLQPALSTQDKLDIVAYILSVR
jgi:mono/diheme cytochrome c family protein